MARFTAKTLLLTCRSQANSVAPLALGSPVICWNVRRSWTWMLFSAEEKTFNEAHVE